MRWRGDVVALARVREHGHVHRVGPFRVERVATDAMRVDGALVPLPSVVTKGAFAVTVQNDVVTERARSPLEVDPVLLRAAGFPLIVMAGLLVALSLPSARDEAVDDAFAFDLARGTLPTLRTSSSHARHASLHFTAPRGSPRATKVKVRAKPDGAMFAPIERASEEDIAAFMSAIAAIDDAARALPDFAVADVPLRDVMSDDEIAAFMASAQPARSNGSGATSLASLGIGIPVPERDVPVPKASPVLIASDADEIEIVFGPGSLGARAAVDPNALPFREPFPEQPEPRVIERYAGAADLERVRAGACPTARDIARAVRKRMPALRWCAERWPDAALGTRIELRWRVDAMGRFVDVTANGVEPPELRSCLAAAVSGAETWTRCDDAMLVTYPLLMDGAGFE